MGGSEPAQIPEREVAQRAAFRDVARKEDVGHACAAQEGEIVPCQHLVQPPVVT